MCTYNLNSPLTQTVLSILLLTLIPSVLPSTLYHENDPLLQLTGDTFVDTVVGSDTAWVVEFYATWCGHCQRFAPLWVEFASNITEWDSVIRVAAVACSEPHNAAICRYYNIWGYPTIKFFPQNFSPGDNNKGHQYKGLKTFNDLKTATLDYVKAQTEANYDDDWPDLEDVREIETFTSLSQSKTAFLVAMGDVTNMYTAYEIILDMSSYHESVAVRWMRKDLVETYNLAPGIYTVTPYTIDLISGDTSRESAVQVIKAEYQEILDRLQETTTSFRTSTSDTKTTTSPTQSTTSTTQQSTTTFSTTQQSTTKFSTTQQSTTTFSTTQQPTTSQTTLLFQVPSTESMISYIPPVAVKMQDLETGLYYSLYIEVGSHRKIQKSSLKALKRHVEVLDRYHPGNKYIKHFISKVHNWLKTVNTTLKGKDWVAKLDSFQAPDSYVPKRIRWTGCLGSDDRYRGYPCSLWQTYHAITVQAFVNSINEPNFEVHRVIRAMRSYVRHYLGCRECAGHFNKMTSNFKQKIKTASDGAVILWEYHNKVNNRLHGDHTEDPESPKVQFPSHEACPFCRVRGSPTALFRNDTEWRSDTVMNYLLTFYGKSYIIQDVEPFHFPEQTTTEKYIPFELGTTPTSYRTTTTQLPCIIKETNWTSCSQSCDTGMSTRITNDNDRCEFQIQYRLCNLRPCNAQFGDWGASRKLIETCPARGSTFQAASPHQLQFQGSCKTLSSHQWRYCGVCPGQCCYPEATRTVSMHVECSGVRSIADIMMFDFCVCTSTCPDFY